MTALTKLITFLKPKPAPPAPAPAVADTEFLEAVAKTWRERYQPQAPKPEFPASQPGQVA